MSDLKDKKYIEAVGRRKTSVARVRLTPTTKKSYEINEKNLFEYFDTSELISIVESPFKVTESKEKYKITVKVSGGGKKAQAESIRLGISRVLIKENPDLRKILKGEGFLKRDPRSKERKKPGLKKARKRPQWSKR